MQPVAPFHLALVGRPEVLERALAALARPGVTEAVPTLRVCCVLPDPPGESPALPTGVAQHPTLEAMLAAHPDLHLLLDLRDDPAAFAALKAALPALAPALAPTLSVGDRHTFSFLEALLGAGLLRRAWRVELEQTRSVLETLFEQSDDEILLLDAHGLVLDANTRACARRGLTRDELLGRAYAQLDSPPHTCRQQDDTPCPVRLAMESGLIQEATLPLVEQDGGLRTLRVVAYPILSTDGVLESLLEVRRDITEMLEMHRRLQQSERLAAIGELSTYIAHEIRNPLFAIAGFANALVRSPTLDEDARQKASIILDESRRLDAILKSTLNFARPLQSAEVSPTALDCNQLVQDTAELFALKCREQGIALQLRLTPSLPLIQVDGELVKQCVINCIKNAMEALEQQGTAGNIILRTAFSPPFVSIAVEDDGPGIPEDIRPRIFNPFFSTKNQGSGLGLAMTKKIIEEMGGEVHLVSQEGQGATITLTLPALPAGNARSGGVRGSSPGRGL